ncbi:MAG: hypothetical protein HY291_19180 [Planctomycetes bacterium]|nr:hypothetical protein [Planctomycetota bacterium]
MKTRVLEAWLRWAACAALAFGLWQARAASEEAQEPIDFKRARELMQRIRSGEKLTDDEKRYVERARTELSKTNGRDPAQGKEGAPAAKTSTGMKPLTELGTEQYKSEDGGLYGGGKNDPPEALQAAIKKELGQIVPLDAEGKPSKEGKIVFVSISMSNATMEFSAFKANADKDPDKSPLLTIVDCAQSGQAMAQWAPPDAKTWSNAEERLKSAGVTPMQVQAAWVKLANVRPTGELAEHGRKLEDDTVKVLNNAKKRYPNLRLTYLSSRIYGGYATTVLNPEPYAYEGAFAARWLIQDQQKGKAELNWDPAKGEVKAPLTLWGPYLWADGLTARKDDGLVWKQEDVVADGTHPSNSGRQKVSDLLLKFFKTNPLAKTWFAKP